MLRGILDQPLKHFSRQAANHRDNFLYRPLPPPQPSEGMKTKKGRNPRSGSSFPQNAFCKRRSLNDERLLNRSLSKDNLGIGLLSHVKVRSIMGDEALNFRVRNGIGCTRFSMDTKEIFQNI